MQGCDLAVGGSGFVCWIEMTLHTEHHKLHTKIADLDFCYAYDEECCHWAVGESAYSKGSKYLNPAQCANRIQANICTCCVYYGCCRVAI